ncbi:hypothetical protein RRG08_022137 [Elysia crispata]|uniref:EF-hand domain-containing protein n=1 Tax=Elysia crispata TaxID=231223 RepID=A0AAE0Y042_9GAST|nr:hypothetical protein RRG08_022137 [Elysia crispata]
MTHDRNKITAIECRQCCLFSKDEFAPFSGSLWTCLTRGSEKTRGSLYKIFSNLSIRLNCQPFPRTSSIMAANTLTKFHTSLFLWTFMLLLAVWTVSAWGIQERSSMPVATVKRSAIDLALTQVYRICDEEHNGFLTQQELQCARRVLRILLTNSL